METDWAENRAKIPQDLIRQSPGQVARLAVFDRRARPLPHPPGAQRRRRDRDLHQPPRHDRGLQHRQCGSRHRRCQHRLAAPPGRPRTRSRVPAPPDGQARRVAGAGQGRRRPPARSRPRRASPGQRPAGGADRRRLRPRLAPCRPVARPHRLHRRRPRPQPGHLLRALCRTQPGQVRAGLLRQAVRQLAKSQGADQVPHRGAQPGRLDRGVGARCQTARPRPRPMHSASSR